MHVRAMALVISELLAIGFDPNIIGIDTIIDAHLSAYFPHQCGLGQKLW